MKIAVRQRIPLLPACQVSGSSGPGAESPIAIPLSQQPKGGCILTCETFGSRPVRRSSKHDLYQCLQQRQPLDVPVSVLSQPQVKFDAPGQV